MTPCRGIPYLYNPVYESIFSNLSESQNSFSPLPKSLPLKGEGLENAVSLSPVGERVGDRGRGIAPNVTESVTVRDFCRYLRYDLP
jgi:hypothetical protein